MLKVFVPILLITVSKACNCHHKETFPSYWSHRRVSMSGAVLQMLETRNMYQCQRLCWLTSPCVSVTFSTSTRLCSMYTDIPGESDIIHSRTDIISSASRPADTTWRRPCHYHTCQNGTVCVSTINSRLCLHADVSCGEPSSVKNAEVTYSSTTYNTTATYSCHTGYAFHGTSQVAVCSGDGSWKGFDGQCSIVTCGEPGNITNADVTYASIAFNSTATYICHQGYIFHGTSHEAVCAEDGLWSGLSGQCDIAHCGIPLPLANADVAYTDMTYNSTALYTCNSGYNFQGTRQHSLCAEDGQWTGFNGTCLKVSCGTPDAVANAVMSYTTVTHASTVTYTCQTGYNFQGSSQTAVCGDDNQWTGFSGSCDIVTCSTPGSVVNGVYTYSTVTYNSIASYTCNTGYHFQNVGPVSTITCQANGQWSALPGGCVNINDCADILAANDTAPDGTYIIRPTVGTANINVYCDMTNHGGGWTVIQRRRDGSEDFWRNWADYRDGFGSITHEFWLGNTAIHRITNQKTYKLRFDLTDFSNNNAYALYSSFSIENGNNKFRLQVNGYSGNAGDSFESYHDRMYFSTKDNDNDKTSSNCGVKMPGGWWYKSCLTSNLNGQYGNTGYSTGVNWESWKGYYYSLKATVMKVRPY